MNPNTPCFIADLYRTGRPLYPREVFRLLERVVQEKHWQSPPPFLDLGCGSGQSTRSFVELGISSKGFAVDCDPAMISAATQANRFPDIDYREGTAESIPLADETVDLVLIGSAVHWFDLKKAEREIARVLRPGGILYVFEYQFPRCLDDPSLAETIRRRFNLEWKAPQQRPRGTLSEILAPIEKSSCWTRYGEVRPEWTERLDLASFLGHLFSQSRYLHIESTQSDPLTYRAEIEASFSPFFASGPLSFDFRPRALAFTKTAPCVKK